MAGRYVALLRGINVGGRNRLPMADLAAIFTDLGCTRVRTWIQSGNVVFEAGAALARQIPGRVAEGIAARHALTVPVVLRSAAELQAVAKRHPLAAGADASCLAVMFLARRPTAAAAAALDPQRSPGDTFRLIGREVFLCCPGGMARSKLTNACFDKALGTVSTTRNWRTVRKLAEMTGEK